MHKSIFAVLCVCLISFAHAKTLFFLDTTASNPYAYQTLIRTCDDLGLQDDDHQQVKIEFCNLYRFLEDPTIAENSFLLVLFDTEIFAQINNPIVTSVLESITNFTNNPNTSTILLFPEGSWDDQLKERIIQICKRCGVYPKQKALVRPFHSFISHLAQPEGCKGKLYGTTLIQKTKTALTKIQSERGTPFEQFANKDALAAILPQNRKPFDPVGWFYERKKTKSRFLIGKMSDFCFGEIQENIKRKPLDPNKNQVLQLRVQRILEEFFNAIPDIQVTHKNIKKICTPKSAITQALSIAWLSPEDFFLKEDGGLLKPKKKREMLRRSVQDGVTFLEQANMDILWFRFNPEDIFADNAINKSNKKIYEKEIRKILTTIEKTYTENQKLIPNVLIGTDITSCFKTQKPKHPVEDIFGKTYENIPSPLDKHVWVTQVVEPIDRFLQAFGAVLPFGGIMLDLEMYHAQEQAGTYTQFMDFSDYAWKLYRQKRTSVPAFASTKEKVAYLAKQKLFEDYFSVLQAYAREIGSMIRTWIQEKIPGGYIGVYLPTLTTHWFYIGLLQGLSTSENPVLCCTFNTDFINQSPWLENNNVYMQHTTVFLLSHLQQEADAAAFKRLLPAHHGLWYNRPSRLLYKLTPEQQQQRWWHVETSPLPTQELAEIIKKIHSSEL